VALASAVVERCAPSSGSSGSSSGTSYSLTPHKEPYRCVALLRMFAPRVWPGVKLPWYIHGCSSRCLRNRYVIAAVMKEPPCS
jgi:hypothetical protein